MLNSLLRKILPAPAYTLARDRYHALQPLCTLAKNWHYTLQYRDQYRERVGEKNIYLLCVPEHKNLGDHAIAQATEEYLSAILPCDTALHQLTHAAQKKHFSCMRKYLNREDVLLINGGGNMGVEWFFYESMTREIISNFPDNRVVIMPQTMFYGDSERGKAELARSVVIYSAHPDLHLFAREKTSYELMKKTYTKNHVYLAPDMVLAMSRTLPRRERSGILLCLRDDPERNLTDADTGKIAETARRFDTDIRFTDTVVTGKQTIALDARNDAIEEMLDQFRRSRLVVTDRLHGMVFAAITGTPCIATGNYNHKVSGVYEWICGLDYIEYCSPTENLEHVMGLLLSLGERSYDEKVLVPLYEQLRQVVLKGNFIV